MFFNDLIQNRLCEARLVAFVMTVFPVAKQIDKYISVETLPVFNSEFHSINHSFDIVGIYMENGALSGFCHIGTIH